MSDNGLKKYQHETLVLFLDDCFCDSETAETLQNAGYLVELMDAHFPAQPAGNMLVNLFSLSADEYVEWIAAHQSSLHIHTERKTPN